MNLLNKFSDEAIIRGWNRFMKKLADNHEDMMHVFIGWSVVFPVGLIGWIELLCYITGRSI